MQITRVFSAPDRPFAAWADTPARAILGAALLLAALVELAVCL